MPKPGESCNRENEVTVADDHVVLVCKSGKWTRQGSNPPVDGRGPTPSREMAKEIADAQRRSQRAARSGPRRPSKRDED